MSSAKVFLSQLSSVRDNFARHLLFIAEKDSFKADSKAGEVLWTSLLQEVKQNFSRTKNTGDSISAVTAQLESLQKLNAPLSDSVTVPYVSGESLLCSVTLFPLPKERSRNNGYIRSDKIPDAIAKIPSFSGPAAKGTSSEVTRIFLYLNDVEKSQVNACVSAVARSYPLYYNKGKGKTTEEPVTHPIVLVDPIALDGKTKFSGDFYDELQRLIVAVRYAAKLTDMPTSELNVTTYVEEVRALLKRSLEAKGVKMTAIIGDLLEKQGFGGLWGVGKASDNPPALVVLSYTPPEAKKTVVWIGKGIVYDTGGLSIKGKEHMPGMKVDMAGSANVLAAFEAVVTGGNFKHNLYAILCLAENSVDSTSTRPDDILTLYSGKTVEINNTDAEGRLVLADGTAYASQHLSPDYIIDLATLTGAQSYATGTRHAGVLCNDESFEDFLVESGKKSGDLLFPLIYCPEFLGISSQFSSEVADMKNSVKDRSNASSSGAGHFIEEHLVPAKAAAESESSNGKTIKWAHVDLAAPTTNSKGRATGFGTSFLIQVAKTISSLS